MNIVILDVETTGDNYLIDEISQISYIILDSDLNIIKAKNFYFMVDYVYFKSSKNKLNIEELKKLSNNKTFKDRYNEIFSDLNNNLIVCHKCDHDINYLKSEFMRVDKDNRFVYEEFCTMKYYTDILKIPSDNFGYKYPKLVEIMPYLNIKRGDINNYSKKIFNLSDSEVVLHDSRVDVVATYLVTIKTDAIVDKYRELISYQNINKDKKCFKKVEEIGKINEDKIKNIKGCVEDTYNDLNNYENEEKEQNKNTSIKNILSFKGEISKKDYRKYILLLIPIYVLSRIVINEIYINSDMSDVAVKGLIKVVSYIFKLLVLTLSVKRLRKQKISLWLSSLVFIPLVNLFLILDLCFGKDTEYENKYKSEYKNKKITWKVAISIGVLSTISAYVYYKIDEANKVDDAISMVQNALYYEEDSVLGNYIHSYIESRMDEIDPYYVDGWYGYKVEKDIYLVCYDFDMEDDDYENGYISYPFEINIETKELTPIVSYNMIKKYEDLGYFNDIDINAFRYEDYIPFDEFTEFKIK